MTKTFPIQAAEDYQHDGTFKKVPAIRVPWAAAEIAYAAYSKRNGTQQSLDRLAERGGFSRDEFLWLLDLAVADAEAVERMRRY